MPYINTNEINGRIILAGRCDHDNFGDSLMFSFFARSISSINRDVYILDASQEFIARIEADNVKVNNLKISDITKNDYVIFVGGGYFGQPESGIYKWQKRFLSGYFPRTINSLISKKIRYSIAGVEAGPITGPSVKKVIKRAIDHSDFTVVRNKGSLEFCRSITQDSKKISYIPDVVLHGAKKLYMELEDECAENQKYESEFCIGIHITGKFFSNNLLAKINFAWLQKSVSSTYQNSSIRIILFFDQTDYQEKLINRAIEFKKQMQSAGHKCDIEKYSGHRSTLTILKACKVLITTKLHCGVCSWGLGNRVFCISDAPKIKRFYSELRLNEFHTSFYFTTSSQKRKKLKAILERGKAETALTTINNAIKESQNYFEIIQ